MGDHLCSLMYRYGPPVLARVDIDQMYTSMLLKRNRKSGCWHLYIGDQYLYQAKPNHTLQVDSRYDIVEPHPFGPPLHARTQELSPI